MNEELCSTVQTFYPIMPQKVFGDNTTEHFIFSEPCILIHIGENGKQGAHFSSLIYSHQPLDTVRPLYRTGVPLITRERFLYI